MNNSKKKRFYAGYIKVKEPNHDKLKKEKELKDYLMNHPSNKEMMQNMKEIREIHRKIWELIKK